MVPEVRFKGFTDDWEQDNIGSHLILLKDGTHGTHKDFVDGPLLLSAKNIKNGKINISNNERHISISDFESIHKSFRLKKGDILLTIVGSIGQTAIYNGDTHITFQRSVAYLRTKDIDSEFLRFLIMAPHFQKKLKINQVVSAQPGIYLGDIKNISIKYSKNSNEQLLIKNILNSIDIAFTLQQRQLDLYKKLKKGLLQKLFPKEGEKVPEVRFAEFHDDWEQHKLKEVSNRYDNLRIPITASDRIRGDTPYYGANGIQDHVKGYTHDGEFILVAEDGANDLKNYPIQYLNGKAWINNHVHVLQSKSKISDNKFLMNVLKCINIEPFIVGGGRAKLNADSMMKIKIMMPAKEEQKEIGTLLQNLDHFITLQQDKLEELKLLKKYLLQNIFI
ncbi:specificity determinant HsdS [Companilactobacillus bobalius DSM 19674]|nr:specificity determinant HsdS [Companilactobacillus bobalius DSM 19674]